MVATNLRRFSSVSVSQPSLRRAEKPTIDASGERRSCAATATKPRMASLTACRSRLASSTLRRSASKSSRMLRMALCVASRRIRSESMSSRMFMRARWLSASVSRSSRMSSTLSRMASVGVAALVSAEPWPGAICVSALVTKLPSVRLDEPSEAFDLLLQLDHLELAPDSKTLESLKLGESVQLLGLLRKLGLGQLLFRHVARRGEHAEPIACLVAVYRGVVQDLGQGPVRAADGQRVVGDRPLGERPLVAFVGLVGLGEVVGECGPDQFLAGDAGNLDGGLVDVGDHAFGADRDQRVKAGLDHGPGGLERLPLLGHIPGDRGRPDDRTVRVVDRRDGE